MKLRHISCLLLLLGYLGVHKGYLALFEDGKPVMILPYKSVMYSGEDQQALQNGISYETEEELTRLLEDFLS